MKIELKAPPTGGIATVGTWMVESSQEGGNLKIMAGRAMTRPDVRIAFHTSGLAIMTLKEAKEAYRDLGDAIALVGEWAP